MAYNPNNPNGQATSANSAPVVIASDQSAILVSQPDLNITGQGTQTIVGNNILLATAGSTSIDATGYMSATVQIASTGTAGTFRFEQSNDDVTYTLMTVYNSSVLTGTAIAGGPVTATVSSLIYTFPINARYIRVRISTTITGGSLQAFTVLKRAAWAPPVVQIAQSTAANLATTATIASGTVTTVSTVTALTAQNSVATTNGLSIGTVITAATPATTSIKATAGRLHFMSVGNPNATAVYLKIFNVAAPTLGTTSANMSFLIPAGQTFNLDIPSQGLFWSTAIVIAVTGGQSLTDNTAITTGASVNYSWI